MHAANALRARERSTRRLILHLDAVDRLTREVSCSARARLEEQVGSQFAELALECVLGQGAVAGAPGSAIA